ncbi:MAG: sensor histidine kinase, partial [Haloarculaceae archaeon]
VEETDLVSIQDVATDAWATATDEAASLEFDQEFYFEADEDRLRQLLENLFRNAVVHGRPDVTVRIGPMEGWPGFYVADDGPGIPEDERETVFESGYTTAEEGTGFGLAIVEVIAEAHGWDVRVTESEDGGARFEFVGVEFE